MSTKSSFLTIALLVYASATSAILDTNLPAQWHEIYSGAEGKSSINMTSVQKTEGGRIVFKGVSTYNTLQQVPNFPLYYTMDETHVAVDCNSKMLGVYVQRYLDENGNGVAKGIVYDEDRVQLESAGPGTLGEKAINVVCNAEIQHQVASDDAAIHRTVITEPFRRFGNSGSIKSSAPLCGGCEYPPDSVG